MQKFKSPVSGKFQLDLVLAINLQFEESHDLFEDLEILLKSTLNSKFDHFSTLIELYFLKLYIVGLNELLYHVQRL